MHSTKNLLPDDKKKEDGLETEALEDGIEELDDENQAVDQNENGNKKSRQE